MAKKEFKAESKKLLDLMINSIYTHNEIFLRELISNASDALDKLYYNSLQSGDTGIKRSDFFIELSPDKDSRTLTITDNGIGMTAEELESNLGTIAQSGTMTFKENMKSGDESEASKEETITDIIGQFGVGFYSSFMVADEVRVTSRAYGSDEANVWISSGADGYTVEPAEKSDIGTEIVLHIKEDTDDEKYSRFLEDFTLRQLIKKYSDYIHYPIKMMVTKTRELPKEDGAPDDEEPKTETYKEMEQLNSMEPLWRRPRNQVTDEEYYDYYKTKYNDYVDPARVIRTSVEGVSSYTALLFIPAKPSFDYYSKTYEKGLQLYSSGVLIMERCEELLPDYFNFVKGLVDSQDLSLNISREMLQHDRQLKSIARNLEKKIKNDLLQFMKDDREGYEKFFGDFGLNLKYGIYEGYGINKDKISDLIMLYSSTEKKLITFDEYIAKMGEDQKYIYYCPGDTVESIDRLPQVEAVKDKGYEVLYCTNEVDEFMLKMMGFYKDHGFKSVSEEEMKDDQTEEEKIAMEQRNADNKEILGFIKETLGDAVVDVVLSSMLKSVSAALSSRGEVSLEMEKTLAKSPTTAQVKAEKVLEINPDSPVWDRLTETYNLGDGPDGKEMTAAYSRLLFDQALLIAGLPVSDPVRMAQDIDNLIAQ